MTLLLARLVYVVPVTVMIDRHHLQLARQLCSMTATACRMRTIRYWGLRFGISTIYCNVDLMKSSVECYDHNQPRIFRDTRKRNRLVLVFTRHFSLLETKEASKKGPRRTGHRVESIVHCFKIFVKNRNKSPLRAMNKPKKLLDSFQRIILHGLMARIANFH
jgi:hypothetical protein